MALTRQERLARYLSEAARREFQPGQWDCLLGFVSDWVTQELGCPDTGAPWRGRYKTALGMARIIRREGGVEAILARGASLAGLSPTQSPRTGDIGIVVTDTPRGREGAGALRTARGWACLAYPSGVLVADVPFQLAWSVCPKLSQP